MGVEALSVVPVTLQVSASLSLTFLFFLLEALPLTFSSKTKCSVPCPEPLAPSTQNPVQRAFVIPHSELGFGDLPDPPFPQPPADLGPPQLEAAVVLFHPCCSLPHTHVAQIDSKSISIYTSHPPPPDGVRLLCQAVVVQSVAR